MESCSGLKLQHTVTYVVLRHRRQKSQALELGNVSAVTGNVVIDGDCFGELDVDPSSTQPTVVDVLVCLRSLVLPQRLFGLPVL